MSGLTAARRLAAIALVLAACLPPHLLARASGRSSPWPQRFFRRAAKVAGIDLMVTGAPPAGRTLIVANHRSWLDIVVIAAASGAAFVSKAEVGRWPVLGWLARLHGTVFVERARRGGVRGQADALRDALDAGRIIALFPEGATHTGPGMLPFKPSLFASVCPAPDGVRVQPALIDFGAHEADVNWPDEESTTRNVIRILGRAGRLPVTVRFLDPIDPAGAADRKALAMAAQRALEDAADSR